MFVRVLAMATVLVGGVAGTSGRAAPLDVANGFDAGGELVVASGPPARRERLSERGLAGAWRTLVDRDTGVVQRMWGSFVDVPGALRDDAIAERAARAFVEAHLPMLAPGSTMDDLELARAAVDDADRRIVTFRQVRRDSARPHERGLPILGGTIRVTFASDRLFVVASEALPVGALGSRPLDDTRGATAILPIIRPRTGPVPPSASSGVPAASVELVPVVVRRDPTADVYLSPDGREVARKPRVAPLATTLSFDVPVRHPAGARADHPAPRVDIRVDNVPATTDAMGRFDATAGMHALAVGVVGPDVRVVDAAGAPPAGQLAVQGGGAVTWSVAADPLADARLSAFIHASIAKARARQLAPSLPWLATPLDVHVNETAFPCNALSTGTSIHFSIGSELCENTARLADVVYHEFAHSLHEQLDPAATPLASLREGLADYYAMTITGDPAIARGFYKDDEPVRQHDPIGRDARFPDDVDPSSTHVTGIIIGGALWDLRSQLVAELGEAAGLGAADRVFAGILRGATDLQNAYLEALAADDDDGDLGNGTPHACAIENAFGRHGLADPAYRAPALATPVVEGTTIRARATPSSGSEFGCAPSTIDSVELQWRLETGGPIEAIAMDRAPVADGESWSATLPAQPDGTVVRYRVVATASDGQTITYPDNPADPDYQLVHGAGVALFCQPMDADPAWRATGSVQWEWAQIPITTSAGDPTEPYSGIGVLGTKIRGNPEYLDSSDSRIATPAIDATGYARVHLQFRRWLAIEDGSADRATIDVDGNVVWQNAATRQGTLHHFDKEWRLVDVDISAHAAAAPIQIGWRLQANASRQFGGWSIDDVCVIGFDKRPLCGDGVVDDGEQCDDANELAHDGCNRRCELDEVHEIGCCSTTRDPRGVAASIAIALAVLGVVGRRRRR